MNNLKKTLQILDIICPAFSRKVRTADGGVDSTTPSGYAVWFGSRCFNIMESIWHESEEREKVDDVFKFFVNLVLSIIVFPFAFVVWGIGNLIFSIHYDKKNQTHLFLLYSFTAALILALCVMVVDYETNGKIQDNINASLASVTDCFKTEEPERNIAREVTDESEINFEVAEEEEPAERVIVREVSEEEPEEEETVSEELVEEVSEEEDEDPEVPLVVEEDEEEGVVVERGTSR